MDKTFKLEIITPYRVFYSGMAEMMIINSVDGELGILPEHESFVTPVVIGPGKIKISGIWKNASVSDGFLEMDNNKVTMLVGAAEWPEEIDAERAAIEAAEQIASFAVEEPEAALEQVVEQVMAEASTEE